LHSAVAQPSSLLLAFVTLMFVVRIDRKLSFTRAGKLALHNRVSLRTMALYSDRELFVANWLPVWVAEF